MLPKSSPLQLMQSWMSVRSHIISIISLILSYSETSLSLVSIRLMFFTSFQYTNKQVLLYCSCWSKITLLDNYEWVFISNYRLSVNRFYFISITNSYGSPSQQFSTEENLFFNLKFLSFQLSNNNNMKNILPSIWLLFMILLCILIVDSTFLWFLTTFSNSFHLAKIS
jgi:hypothetical protein